jgi:hypothetical protein
MVAKFKSLDPVRARLHGIAERVATRASESGLPQPKSLEEAMNGAIAPFALHDRYSPAYPWLNG